MYTYKIIMIIDQKSVKVLNNTLILFHQKDEMSTHHK